MLGQWHPSRSLDKGGRWFVFLAVAAGWLGSALPALSQSSPGLYQGQVPTAGQWNAYFAAKQDVLGYTPLNKAGDTMLGRLITGPAGSTTAGVNFPPSSTPSMPVDGDVWVTSIGMFVQVNGSTIGPLTGPGGGSFAATAPLGVTFPAGVTTYALQYDSNFTNNGSNQLALASIASGSLIANSGAGSAEPSASTPSAWLSRWCSGTSGAFPTATGASTWGCGTTGTSGHAIPYLDGANTWTTTQTFTAAPVFSNQSGSRTALGLGTAAVQNTGTSGANVPLLNASNTWGGTQGFSAATISTPLGLSSGGSGQATAAAARGASGFNIEEATSVGDTNGTIAATDRTFYHTALSAARTDTLPAANAVNAGQWVYIVDFRGVATGSNTVTLARAGADTVNGGTTFVAVNAAYGWAICQSDGVSRWGCAAITGSGGGGGSVTSATIAPGTGIGVTGTCTITTTGTCTIAIDSTVGIRTGSFVTGNVICATNTTGTYGDCGFAPFSTVSSGTVYSNNTTGSAAPGFNAVLALLDGSSSGPAYSFANHLTQGMYYNGTSINFNGNTVFGDQGTAYKKVTIHGASTQSLGIQSTSANAETSIFFTDTSTDEWRMGANVSANGRFDIRDNTTGTDAWITNGSTSWTFSSDGRMKENVQPIASVLDRIDGFQAVTFDWIKRGAGGEIQHGLGVIAQDLYLVFPELVDRGSDGDLDPDGKGQWSARVTPAEAMLFHAMKELLQRVRTLESK